MRKTATACLAALVLTMAPAAWAQGLDEVMQGFDEPAASDTGLDEVLDGFEDQPGATTDGNREPEQGASSFFDFSGSLKLEAAYSYAHDAPGPGGTDHRGLSRLRPRIDLEIDARFSDNFRGFISGHGFYDLSYSYHDRENYTRGVLDTYEDEMQLEEAWLSATLTDNLDIKLGRQIVVWGKADQIRVVDVLNPLDQRDPGMVDVEDLRLPVYMTRLDYYFGDWNLSGILIHEVRYNRNPAFGSDYFPYAQPARPDPAPTTDRPIPEYGIALKGIFSGWDLSFFHAYVYDDAPHMEIKAPPPLPGLPPLVGPAHSRLTMFGAAANLARGNWLLKAEAAWLDGFEFYNRPGEKRARLDVMLGLEYSGFKDTTITLEAANRHLMDWKDSLAGYPDYTREDEFQTSLRITRDFMHERLELSLLLGTYGAAGENGAYQRFTATYDFTDHWSGTLGLVLYQSGDQPLANDPNKNDRVFGNLTYRF